VARNRREAKKASHERVEAQTWRMDLQNKIQGTRLLFMRTPVVLRKPIIAWSLTTPFTSHISWIYNILLVLSFFFCVWTARISGQDQRKPNTAQDPDPSVLMSPGDYERFLPFLFMDVRSKACVRERETEREREMGKAITLSFSCYVSGAAKSWAWKWELFRRMKGTERSM
jgi:hypothetical protein